MGNNMDDKGNFSTLGSIQTNKCWYTGSWHEKLMGSWYVWHAILHQNIL